jgi:Sap-like sulfolipid-1-addressing protein
MGDAIGQVLPFAFGVAVSPMAIIAMVLMLTTPGARVNSSLFLLGWIVGVAVTGAIVLAIAGPADSTDQGAPADWVNVLELVLGILLLRVAVREWRARPAPGSEPTMPKWMGMLDGITPAKAAGLAVVLSAVNPKNLVLIVGGATSVAQTDISGSEQAISWLVFTVIATIGVATPMLIYLFMGSRAAQLLDRLKTSMAHHNAAVMAVLCLIIGVKLIGDAISGFSA